VPRSTHHWENGRHTEELKGDLARLRAGDEAALRIEPGDDVTKR
jgi:hypothetical protein